MIRRTNKLIGLMGVLILLLMAVPTTFAFEGRGGEEDGENVTIAEDEVIKDDLYVGGNVITIDGTVEGDVFAGGTKIVVNGTIEGDFFAGGQIIEINGEIGDDVRVGGTSIIVGEDAKIGSDFMVGGQGIEVKAGSSIGGDALVGGTQILMAGDIDGDLRAGAGALEIDGEIGGNVIADVGGSEAPPFDVNQIMKQFMPDIELPTMPDVASGLTLGDNADIKGDLNYESVTDFDIEDDTVDGDVVFNQTIIEEKEEPAPLDLFLARLWNAFQQWIVLFVIGLLLLWLLPATVRGTGEALRGKGLWALLSGLLILIVLPIFLILLLIILGVLSGLLGAVKLGGLGSFLFGMGLLFTFVVVFLYIITAVFLGKLIVGYRLGRLIISNPKNNWLPLGLGLLLIIVLTAIPFGVGGVISFLIVLAGLGSIWFYLRRKQSLQDIISTESLKGA